MASNSGSKNGSSDASTPPYLVPFRTFLNLIEKMGAEGVPGRIDKSSLSHQPGGMQTHIKSALRFFGLMDEQGIPDRRLEDFARSDERPAYLRALIEVKYSKQLGLGQNATQAQLQESFGPALAGESARKAATFFVHAANYAGLGLSPHYKLRGAATAATKPRARRKTKTGQRKVPKGDNTPTQLNEKTIRLQSGGKVTLAYEIDLFTATDEDNEFVRGLVKQVRDYEAANVSPEVDGLDDDEAYGEEE